MVISRRSLLLAGVALPVAARAQCVTDTPAVDACMGGVRITVAPPSLDLSFMTPGTLPPGLTFTRASTGTYFDVTGTMQTATTNTPRWDYSPSALTLNGLLIEEARTNSALQSADFSQAVWQKQGATPPVVTADQTVAPDGTTTADAIAFPTVSGVNAVSQILQAVTVTANPYAYSVFLKGSVGGEQIYMYNRMSTYSAPLLVTLTTSWQRFVMLTPTLTAGTWNFYIGVDLRDTTLIQTAKPASTFYAWGGQIELGNGATSHIPTTTVAVTRALDACSGPTGAWFNAAASSLAADYMVAQAPNPSGTLARQPAALSDGTGNNRLRLIGQQGASGGSNAILASSVAGVGTTSTALGAASANAVAKMAGSWNGTIGIGSLNGGAAVSYAVGMPTLNLLTIGNDIPSAISVLNGWVRRVRYWNTALSAAQLQSVTT